MTAALDSPVMERPTDYARRLDNRNSHQRRKDKLIAMLADGRPVTIKFQEYERKEILSYNPEDHLFYIQSTGSAIRPGQLHRVNPDDRVVSLKYELGRKK